MENCLDSSGEAKYFSTLDCHSDRVIPVIGRYVIQFDDHSGLSYRGRGSDW